MKTAAPKDRSYLEQLNFKKLQKGKKPDGENPKLFYKQLQDEAKSGPVFDAGTLDVVEGLPDLPKPVTKWIANLSVKDKLDHIKPQELGLIIDWVRQSDDGGTTINTLSWDEAVKAQKSWHDSKFQVSDTGDYLENNVVGEYNGYTIVQIENEQDLDTEGELMGHCVGGDNYWQAVRSGKTQIYSLRDSSNKPHVTMEVTDGEMRQCFGKQNATPVAKYHPALKAFFNEEDLYEGYALIHEEIPEEFIPRVIQYGGEYVLTSIASSTKNPKTLAILAQNQSSTVRYLVAANILTPSLTLVTLAKDKNNTVRQFVALNPNSNANTLKLLAKDDKDVVRIKVAENPNTPPDVLRQLADDDERPVRFRVARNPNTPIEVLQMLADDEDYWVRKTVINNPEVTDEILRSMVDDANVEVLTALVKNQHTPSDVLAQLSNYEDNLVRNGVARNPNTPMEVLERLATDEDEYVRYCVTENPNCTPELLDTVKKSQTESRPLRVL